MTKRLTGRALARFEDQRDIWQEVLDGVREIKAGLGKRAVAEPRSPVVRARLKSGLTQAQFAALLGVSKRTLEQWEQGRREPSENADPVGRDPPRGPPRDRCLTHASSRRASRRIRESGCLPC
jgi:putative transcriptional regulator